MLLFALHLMLGVSEVFATHPLALPFALGEGRIIPVALPLALPVALCQSEIIPVALPFALILSLDVIGICLAALLFPLPFALSFALDVSGIFAKLPLVLPSAFQTSSFIVSCFP